MRPGAVFALTGHVARFVPWGTLAAGACAGLGFSLVVRGFADPATPQAELITGVRLSFLPPVASLGFALHDRHRQLAGALPVPAWATAALRLCLALPVIALTCWLQFWLVASALAAAGTGRTGIPVTGAAAAGGGQETLPVPPLATEFAGCCVIMLAVAAAVERGRWRDLGGGAGVPMALAVLAALAGLSMLKGSPVRLLPTAFYGMTAAQRHQWDRAWLGWAAVGLAAAIAAGWFSRDPWRRMRLGRVRHGRCASRHASPSGAP
jgi:hypothetical protein